MFSFLDLCMAFAVVSLLISICIVSVLLSKHLPLLKCCQNIPTFKTIPIITYLQLLKQAYRSKNPRVALFQILEGAFKIFTNDSIWMIWVAYRPFIIFNKPDAIEVLLNSSSSNSKAIEYDFLKPWIKTGLLTSDGDKWRKHRKLLTPSFHFQILENFISVFNEQATILTRKLELEISKNWMKIDRYITMCTLDIICETAMGTRLNIQSGRSKDYVENVERISEAFIYRLTRPWLWLDPIFLYLCPAGWQYKKSLKAVHDFTKKVIKEKKQYMMIEKVKETTDENAQKRKRAFLECLIECHLNDETFTEENISEEVDTFMFEGHDTTASALTSAIYHLGQNQDVQEKVIQELDDIFGDDSDRDITSEDLKNMKYLECVIKENLRLNPPVSFFGRQIKEKLVVGNYTLLPGSSCVVSPYNLHRDPEIFSEPELFKPERFLLSNSMNRHPYAYLPFSGGPRNCIGQRFALLEMKTVLAYIFRKFQITSLNEEMQRMLGIIMKNAEPVRIKFAVRRKNTP